MGRAHEVRAASMAKTAAAKSKMYAKYGVAIYKAAKSGIPDPDLNQALKKEIERAKKANVTANVIQRAIDKAQGGAEGAFEEIRYEGFGPSGSLIIVDCVSDNANRTYTEIRTIFNKANCKLGVLGSVTHMFDYGALFNFEGLDDEVVLEALLEADCDITDLDSADDIISIFAPATEYQKIKEALLGINPDLEFIDDEVTFLPRMKVEISEEDEIKQLKRLLSNLNEHDDVQQVYHNVQGIEEDEEE